MAVHNIEASSALLCGPIVLTVAPFGLHHLRMKSDGTVRHDAQGARDTLAGWALVVCYTM